ncbi:MAG: hypothetical protein WBG38_15740, partial [Nodosilinea sp.]
MSFFRSYVAPFIIVLIFAVAMLAVSARIFLPSDMMAPAPIEEPVSSANVAPSAPGSEVMSKLSAFVYSPGG